jgi:hypothetical protein
VRATGLSALRLGADVFVNRAECGGRCGANGCCTVDGQCECAPGWAGGSCNISTTSCPDSAGTAAAPLAGLRGEYFNQSSARRRAFVRSDAAVDFTFGSDGYQPRVAVWTGYYRAAQTGWHWFAVESESAQTRLWLNSRASAVPTSQNYGRAVHLIAGRLHTLRLFYNWTSFYSSGVVRLRVQGPNTYSVRRSAQRGARPVACTLLTRVAAQAVASAAAGELFSVGGLCTCAKDERGRDCNGRGTCLNGACACNAGYYGDSCEFRRCRNDECLAGRCTACNDRGACVNGECRCTGGFDPTQNCQWPGCTTGRACVTGSCSAGRCTCPANATGFSCDGSLGSESSQRPGWLLTSYSDDTFNNSINARAVSHVFSTAFGATQPDFPADARSVIWSGRIRARISGTHTFFLLGPPAGATVIVPGLTTLAVPALQEISQSLPLQSGQALDVLIRAALPAGAQSPVRLSWTEPGRNKSLLAADAVTHLSACPGCRGICAGAGGCLCPLGRVGASCDRVCESSATTAGWIGTFYATADDMVNYSNPRRTIVVASIDNSW